jgi:preprotein translocase subunit YajC
MMISSFGLLLNFIAMGTPQQPGEDPMRGLLMNFGPIIIIMVIFYLILIRPQQKQQKEQQKMIDALKVGDQIVTTSGICGMVQRLKEKEKSLILKSADETKIEVLRSSVQQVRFSDSKADAKEISK